MNCPECNNEKTGVVVTRKPVRTRRCPVCNFKFDTTEVVSENLYTLRRHTYEAQQAAKASQDLADNWQAKAKSNANIALRTALAVLKRHEFQYEQSAEALSLGSALRSIHLAHKRVIREAYEDVRKSVTEGFLQ